MNYKDAINKSGFPLQIALENLIGRVHKPDSWRVIYSEHQWKDPDTNETGFIDLVFEFAGGIVVLVVECKRVYDSSWIFLNSRGESNSTNQTKAWVSQVKGPASLNFGWKELNIDPASPECEYSIVWGQDPKSKPMLERTAATLISSTEALAKEELRFLNDRQDRRIYFNVIVTTASLAIAKFEPSAISIKNGTIDDAECDVVPCLRFRKQLQPQMDQVKKGDLNHALIAKAKENSVFVVNSEHVTEFLNAFDLGRQWHIFTP